MSQEFTNTQLFDLGYERGMSDALNHVAECSFTTVTPRAYVNGYLIGYDDHVIDGADIYR